MRTIIELPPAQIDALDALCQRQGISRAEAIRQAVAILVGRVSEAARSSAFGLWRNNSVEALAYERRMRAEWEAPARHAPASRKRSKSTR